MLNEVGPIISALLSHSGFDADDNSLSALGRHSYFSPEPVSNSSFCSNNSYLSLQHEKVFPSTYLLLLTQPSTFYPILQHTSVNCTALSCKQQQKTTTGVTASDHVLYLRVSKHALPCARPLMLLMRIVLPVQWSKELNMQQNLSQAQQVNLYIQ